MEQFGSAPIGAAQFRANSSLVMDLDSQLREVEKAIQSEEKVLLWIGSGLSRIAGCPSWKMLVQEIFETELMRDLGHRFDHVWGRMEPPDILMFCRKQYETNKQLPAFKTLLMRSAYYDSNMFKDQYVPIVKAIRSIEPKVPIITTNIDNCLELT
ncbi:MAG: hypothetical protein KAR20_27190, partial [Candidatus Heimdallarchaeota archaeon]|nr:hypothetical protein [Candidatus Heimdallarchaeota archaeon]